MKKLKKSTTIRLPSDLKAAAIAQGINISETTREALIKKLQPRFILYSEKSYSEALKIAKKFKLEFHIELIEEIAKAIEKK